MNLIDNCDDIQVSYDGKYPNACRGTLTIKVNGEVIYSKKYVTDSTGSCGFTNNYQDSYIDSGELVWEKEEAEQFSKAIQLAVQDRLSDFSVCCGGCL